MSVSIELVLFALSVIVNAVILVLVYKFKDLIKIGLLFRREMKRRGYLKINVKKMVKIVDRLEKFNDMLDDLINPKPPQTKLPPLK